MTTCWMRFLDQAKETSSGHSKNPKPTQNDFCHFNFLMTKIAKLFFKYFVRKFNFNNVQFLISWRFKNHFKKIWKNVEIVQIFHVTYQWSSSSNNAMFQLQQWIAPAMQCSSSSDAMFQLQQWNGAAWTLLRLLQWNVPAPLTFQILLRRRKRFHFIDSTHAEKLK